MKRKVLAAILALTMVFGLAACGSKGASSDGGSSDSGSGDLIKVGIINNDPNESGYRTANDKDMKEMFTKENGYDASFAYSLKVLPYWASSWCIEAEDMKAMFVPCS